MSRILQKIKKWRFRKQRISANSNELRNPSRCDFELDAEFVLAPVSSQFQGSLQIAVEEGQPGTSLPEGSSHTSIADLPVEVLDLIFFSYIYNGHGLNSNYLPLIIPHGYRGPLLISSVCSHWRHVALSSPNLWSSIFVSKFWRTDIRLINLWLQRSKARPLTLGLDQRKGRDTSPLDFHYTEDVLSLFATQIHRWRRISFGIKGWAVQVLFGASFPSALLLDSLDLGISLTRDECVTLIRHCTVASEISIWNVTHGPWEKSHLPVTLPHLRQLIIHEATCDFTEILAYFTLPKLTSFSVQNHGAEGCYERLSSFFERSACRIERLAFLNRRSNTELNILDIVRKTIVHSYPRVTFFVDSDPIDGRDFLDIVDNSVLASDNVFHHQGHQRIQIGWGKPCFPWNIDTGCSRRCCQDTVTY
ncbi:hypothetical protein B0H34DRAFT_161314 [Crassisporium funariophilum]|nr:hypothetical protein B0H34DRAFT_161314 [Crassisporium funariophilum]